MGHWCLGMELGCDFKDAVVESVRLRCFFVAFMAMKVTDAQRS